MERAVLAMDLALAARTQAGSGRLVVTAPPLIVASGLADDLNSFAAQNPGIEITLRASDSTLNLHKREADVSIRVSRDPEPSLWGRVLVPQRAAWCATQGFLDRHREGLAAAGQGVPILSFDSWPHPVPVTLSPVLPLAHVAMTVDDMISAVALAQTGVAMLRMPVFLTALHRDLRPVPGLAPVDYMPIWCLTHPDLRQVPHVRALMRHLADSFAARRGIYAGADPDGVMISPGLVPAGSPPVAGAFGPPTGLPQIVRTSLPVGFPGFQSAMRRSRFGQRQAGDLGPQHALFQQGEDLGQIGVERLRGSDEIGVDIADPHRDGFLEMRRQIFTKAARRRTGQEPEQHHRAQRCQRVEIGFQRFPRNRVQAQIHAAPAGQVLDTRGHIFAAIVDHVIGALRAGIVQLVGAGRGDHCHAQMFGDVLDHGADTPGSGVDQHALARRRATQIDQHVPGGHGVHRHRCGGGELHVLRNACHIGRADHRMRSIATRADRPHPGHPVAQGEAFDPVAQPRDHTGRLQRRAHGAGRASCLRAFHRAG